MKILPNFFLFVPFPTKQHNMDPYVLVSDVPSGKNINMSIQDGKLHSFTLYWPLRSYLPFQHTKTTRINCSTDNKPESRALAEKLIEQCSNRAGAREAKVYCISGWLIITSAKNKRTTFPATLIVKLSNRHHATGLTWYQCLR
jgi:hypothetical protein